MKVLTIVLTWLSMAMPLCAQAQQVNAAYRIGPGDGIRIAVQDMPELSGIFTLSIDGTVAVPMLSGLALNGLTLGEASEAIRSRLSQRVVDPKVALEMARYRPFFVTGDVQKPGSYDWIPGLTVEKAAAAAGGVRARGDPFQSAVTGIRAAERHATLRRELAEARAQRARLQAETRNEQSFEAPEPGRDAQARVHMEEAVARQRELMQFRADAYAQRLALLEKDRDLRDQEITALEARIESHRRLADQLATELKTVRDYVSRGLSPLNRVNELSREENRLQSDTLQSSIMLTQARQSRNQAEIQLQSMQRERRLSNITELADVEARIARLQNEIRGDQSVMAESDRIGAPKAAVTTYAIRRSSAMLEAPLPAETKVEPDDLVVVERSLD